MSKSSVGCEHRILIIDDNPAIHTDFRKCFAVTSPVDLDFEAMEAALFDRAIPRDRESALSFEIDSAFHGMEGFTKVRNAIAEGRPYAVAFVDMRMPPGWDGVETLERIFAEDPHIQAVICSAYSDFPWNEIERKLPQTDRYLILKKPFERIEVRQMGSALVQKWQREATLRASETKLRALLNALPDVVVRVDRNGMLLEHHDAPGMLPALATADRLMTIVDTADREPLQRALEDTLTHRAPRTLDLRIHDGSRARLYETRMAASGASEGVLVLRDVTAARDATAAEAQRREHELVLRAQLEALRELSIPVIPITPRVLVMPLVGVLDAARGARMREILLERVVAQNAHTAIVDVTGIPRFDLGAAEEIARVAHAVRLVGARFVLTGLGGETARQLIALGIDLEGICTRRTLQGEVEIAVTRKRH